MNVAHLLIQQATVRPNAIALVEGNGRSARRITFAELDSLSTNVAEMLRRDGVKANDHVLIFVPMSIDLYLALIAVFRLGAVATFLDPSAGLKHISHCCQMAKPAAFIGLAKAHLLRLVSPALRQIPAKYSIGFPLPGTKRWRTNQEPTALAETITPRNSDDTALLTFTSGSTGAPKAAGRSHGFLTAQHRALEPAIDLEAGEVDLATLPIFALANLASGVTTLIPTADLRKPGSVDADSVLRQATSENATRSTASPAFFERLLGEGDAADRLGGFRRIYTGGAPVFPGLLERLQSAAPAARIVAVYGSTEAEPVAHIAWDEVSKEDSAAMFAGSGLLAGLPVKEIELQIISNVWGTPIAPMGAEAFRAMSLAPGDVGEIVVHGEHVLKGYMNGVGDEATKFRVDGEVWHRTGDAGYLDATGRLWLLGRAEARVTDDRGTIYPFAVECAASRITGVRRSALLQHSNKRVLVVEPRDRLSDEQLAAIRSSLAWAKLDAVIPMKSIPVDKRHNAKVDYPALRAAVSSRII